MRKLAERVMELAPEITELMRLANRIDTTHLSDALYRDVFHTFEMIKPFSYEVTIVTHIDKYEVKQPTRGYWYGHHSSASDENLVVNDWIGLNDNRWKGSKSSNIYDHLVFFHYIRDFGMEVASHVRIPIKEDFPKLVTLAKTLTDYNSLSFQREPSGPLFTFSYDGTDVLPNEKLYKHIEIETREPRTIMFLSKDIKENYRDYEFSQTLTDPEKIYQIEQIAGEIKSMYLEAKEVIDVTIAHNDPIIDAMKDLVAPYEITKALKS